MPTQSVGGTQHAGGARASGRRVARGGAGALAAETFPPDDVSGGPPRAQIAEIQRSRLLAGAVRSVEELGYARTTVAHITARARVSRRTFYELFASRDECLAAVIDDLVARVQAEIAVLGLEQCPWRERVRGGLGAILAFLDSEPELARVCVVQAQPAGAVVLERREQILSSLRSIVDEGRREHARGAQLTPLTAEGLVGAAFAVVYARLLRREGEPLTALQGELMGLIVLPYLGAGIARREQTRPAPARRPAQRVGGAARTVSDPLEGVPMRLTYRTTRVLEVVAQNPQASNCAVARWAGITDQGQVSKLLARLQRLGLLAKASEGHLKGEPNAWTLTPRGQQVAERIRIHTTGTQRAA